MGSRNESQYTDETPANSFDGTQFITDDWQPDINQMALL